MQKSKRNNAFTLAEVLITLVIIGVIASLVIPGMLASIQDSQYKAAWKKAYAVTSQVTNRIMLDNGGTLRGIMTSAGTIRDLYEPYLSYAKKCNIGQNCWHEDNNWYYMDSTPVGTLGNYPGFILADGTLITFYSINPSCTYGGYGLLVCGEVVVDVNGFKGPNTIGKDIFISWIQENGLKPTGALDNYVNFCNATSNGYGCAALYLKQ